ncbi:redoxin domain-containing protein [Xanthomarina gelatinilytica]|uniref:redoxin domain-containing protein n=1 Tax=Xanthomarina gelatinilytica TaxID=1137281 RepID=UPI003AA7F0C5
MLRNFIPFFLILLTLNSCKEEQSHNGFIINGKIDGPSKNYKAKLISFNNNKEVILDSTTVVDGKLTLKGNVDSPDLHYLAIDGLAGFMPIMVENEKMEVTLYKDSLQRSLVKGSKENDLLKIYHDDSEMLKMKNAKFGRKYRTAQEDSDSLKMEETKAEFNKLIEETNAKHIEIIKNNPDLVTSAAILGNLYNAKAISKEEAKSIFSNFSKEVTSSKFGELVNKLLSKASTEVGNVAPDFSAPNPDGKLITLSDIKGKVTIIDFWAAWCGPCRKENPNVVKVYEKYHDKGLEIIGVSLDGTPNQKDPKAAWMDAIEKDNLTWHQVSNLSYFNDPIAKLYSIQAIPATYILDSEGVIVAKNLRGDALEAKIAELLD